MTPEQQKAIAAATARMNAAQQQGGDQPPELSASDKAGQVASAAVSGAVEGVPILGPAIRWAGNRADAALATLKGGSYADNLAKVQKAVEAADVAHPWVHTGGKVAGAVASTLPLMSVAPAAFGAQEAALGARMLTGGLGSAALGAGDSLARDVGTDKSTGDRVADALMGGAISGGLGAAAVPVAAGAGGLVRYLRYGRAADAAARSAGTSRDAVDIASRALHADEALDVGAGRAANARINAAGPRAMLADAGPATMGQLDAAVARGGPGSAQAAQRIGARAAGASQDVNAALDQGLGRPGGMVRPLTEIRTGSAPARGAAYDAAYAQPIDYASPHGQALQHALETRVPPKAIAQANELMRTEGNQSRQIMANIADDGTVSYRRMPDVRQIDYITRGLNEVADQQNAMGQLGGTTDVGRAYGNLSRHIRGVLGDHVPEYRTALNTAADPIAQQEAMRFGQNMLSPNVARDEVEAFVHGMPPAHLQAVRTGLRSSIDETLANVKNVIADPNIDAQQGLKAVKDLTSPAVRTKIGAIMDPQEANRMFRAIDEASTAFRLRAGVARGSQTYGRQAAEQVVNERATPGFGWKMANWQPVKAFGGLSGDILGAGGQSVQETKDAIWHQVSDLLSQPANQGGGRVLQSLREAGRAAPIAEREGRAVDRAIMYGSRPLLEMMKNKKKQPPGGLIGTIRQGG